MFCFMDKEMEAESCGSCGSVKFDPRTHSLDQGCPLTQARGTPLVGPGLQKAWLWPASNLIPS